VNEKGVEDFLEFAKQNGASINGRYYCPCVNCVNGKRLHIEFIGERWFLEELYNVNLAW